MLRLSGQDAFFLYRETPTTPQHTLKVAVYVPPSPPRSHEEVKADIARHLPLLPALRQRLVFVPFGLHHPVWIEDPDFDLDFHVRHARVAAPGGSRELDALISEIAGGLLERSRPLWELWLIEGLADGQRAAVVKVHHAVADGVASAALIERTAVRSSEAEPPAGRLPQCEPVPSRSRLLRDALADWIRLAPKLPAMLATTARALRRLIAMRRAAKIAAPLAWDTPSTPFNKALHARRVFATGSLPLDECRRVKASFGATLNDVVLALCAGSLRSWLAERGGSPRRALIASVPVAADEPGAPARLQGNRVAYFQTSLRADLADPVERLLATRAVTLEAKRQLEVVGRTMALEWMEYLPPVPYTLLKRLHGRLRLADRYPSPSNLVVSNMAGPRDTLYWSGARLVELYSVGPLSEGIGINLTVWSYRHRLYCALLACPEQVPDPHAILAGLEEELRMLLAASARAEPSDAAPPARACAS